MNDIGPKVGTITKGSQFNVLTQIVFITVERVVVLA